MFGNKVIRKPEHDIVLRRGEVQEPVARAGGDGIPGARSHASGSAQLVAELLPVAVATCACGHRVEDHDAIARRYCAATIAAVLPRGCICGLPPADRRL